MKFNTREAIGIMFFLTVMTFINMWIWKHPETKYVIKYVVKHDITLANLYKFSYPDKNAKHCKIDHTNASSLVWTCDDAKGYSAPIPTK